MRRSLYRCFKRSFGHDKAVPAVDFSAGVLELDLMELMLVLAGTGLLAGFSTRPSKRRRGTNPICRHAVPNRHPSVPFHLPGAALTLSAGAKQAIEGDHVGAAALAAHLLPEAQRDVAPPAALGGRDEAAKGDDVALAAAGGHVLRADKSRAHPRAMSDQQDAPG